VRRSTPAANCRRGRLVSGSAGQRILLQNSVFWFPAHLITVRVRARPVDIGNRDSNQDRPGSTTTGHEGGPETKRRCSGAGIRCPAEPEQAGRATVGGWSGSDAPINSTQVPGTPEQQFAEAISPWSSEHSRCEIHPDPEDEDHIDRFTGFVASPPCLTADACSWRPTPTNTVAVVKLVNLPGQGIGSLTCARLTPRPARIWDSDPRKSSSGCDERHGAVLVRTGFAASSPRTLIVPASQAKQKRRK